MKKTFLMVLILLSFCASCAAEDRFEALVNGCRDLVNKPLAVNVSSTSCDISLDLKKVSLEIKSLNNVLNYEPALILDLNNFRISFLSRI